jgi:hypothetical protein
MGVGDKNQRQLYAPNLFRLTNFVNSITLWVATEIVTTANAKIRQRVIQHFVEIAKVRLIPTPNPSSLH